MTLTTEQCEAIAAKVKATKHIPSGIGTEKSACSVGMINLALTGTLTDRIPDCMSPAVGQWIIGVQDAMPDEMRNSKEWRRLLPAAAGTGRGYEEERLSLVMAWMWGVVLPTVQPIADKGGYGTQWAAMCEQRTEKAAAAAAGAAAWAARAAARAAAGAAAGAGAAAWAAAWAAAGAAAWAARAAAGAAARAAAWNRFNPVALLEQLIAVSPKGCE